MSLHTEKLCIIHDAEPDDAIALMQVANYVKKQGINPTNVCIVSTLRNPVESVTITQRILDNCAIHFRLLVGRPGLKAEYGMISKEFYLPSKDFGNMEEFVKFVNDPHKRTNILLLAPAWDFTPELLAKLQPERIASIWNWGGVDFSCEDTLPTRDFRYKITTPSNSFNWRADEKESTTLNLLKWCQTHKIKCRVATPTIYLRSIGTKGINESKHQQILERFHTKPHLKFLKEWMFKWNEMMPAYIQKRLGIVPGKLQFMPADSVATTLFLHPDLIDAPTIPFYIEGDECCACTASQISSLDFIVSIDCPRFL